MAGITKRATRLSDGRELFYFDDEGTSLPARRATDTRPPAPRPALPALRQDPLTGEWISIAAARQARAFLPPAELDPLAPSTPGNPTEIPDNYDVAVFENKSPSFGPGTPSSAAWPDGDGSFAAAGLDTIGLGRSLPGYGRCEVVCFGPHRGQT
jgi:UDPglucose--hexose-1-phosphate uridylyltransferase